VIDAHQHFLDPERVDYSWIAGSYEPLRRPYGPAELRPDLDAALIDRTIAVQARNELDETDTLLRLAAEDPRIGGVVGWVDLTDPAVGEVLATVRARSDGGRLVGIRHLVHDEPDPEWLIRPDVERGLAAVADAGLAFDLLVRPRELPAALVAVDRHPDLSFVVDHLAKPSIAAGEMEPWASLLRPFGARPNVSAKLSGFVTEMDWTGWSSAELIPFVGFALEVFGPERLMFGSDWPVCLLAGSYEQVVSALLDALGDIPGADRATIFGKTAQRVYRLS
jgi:L-fuconolactonase